MKASKLSLSPDLRFLIEKLKSDSIVFELMGGRVSYTFKKEVYEISARYVHALFEKGLIIPVAVAIEYENRSRVEFILYRAGRSFGLYKKGYYRVRGIKRLEKRL